MNNLAVKKVDFQGDTLIAAQDQTTEKIYVSINYICENLGLNARKQRDKIKRHPTLTQGCTNLVIPTNGGNQDMYVIELDYLPLWLASINPLLVKEELTDKLIEYQLKAKEVLANAFVRDVTQMLPKTYKEALYQLIEQVEENERLEAENKKLEQENKQMLPKAEVYDDFIDGQNVLNMTKTAKTLGLGRNKLLKFLREQNVFMKNNTPYQEYLERGYFKVKIKPITQGNIQYNITQTFVTPTGMEYLNKLLKKHEVERVI